MKENLYHFTNHYALKTILESGLRFTRNDLYNTENFPYYYTISTTRNYDFKWVVNGCRIVLDKEKIKKKYIIKPIHWYNKSNARLIDSGYSNSSDIRPLGHDSVMNQFEERICLNPIDVYRQYFISPKYIKQIDILNVNDGNKIADDFKKKIESINIHNIKINYVDKYKPIKEMKHIKTYNKYINL